MADADADASAPNAVSPHAVELVAAVAPHALLEWLRDYARRRLDTGLYDRRRMLAPHVVLDLSRAGLFGLLAPASLGGLQLAHRDVLAVEQQLAAIDVSIAAMVGIHNALGLHPVLTHGSPRQREAMRPFIEGRALLGFALSEAGAGSDPRGLKTTAIACADGTWRLEGDKIWIGNAGWSQALIVVARTRAEDGGDLGFTAFLIPSDREGVSLGAESMTMGLRSIVQNEVGFRAVRVRADEVLGAVGKGLDVANSAMKMGRLGIGAMSVGVMKRCLLTMGTYALRRTIADRRLLDRHAVAAALRDMGRRIDLLEAALNRIAGMLDDGLDVPEALSLAMKIVAPELAWTMADAAVQMLGGRGYEEANGIARLFRDVRVLRIFEGPTESLRAYLGTTALFSARTMESELARVIDDAPALAEATRDIAAWAARTRAFMAEAVPAKDARLFVEAIALPLGELVAWRLMLLLDAAGAEEAVPAAMRRGAPDLAERLRAWEMALRWDGGRIDKGEVIALLNRYTDDVGATAAIAAREESEVHHMDRLLRPEAP